MAGYKYSPHPYDADNNLTQKTDRKGQTITYLYDALNLPAVGGPAERFDLA